MQRSEFYLVKLGSILVKFDASICPLIPSSGPGSETVHCPFRSRLKIHRCIFYTYKKIETSSTTWWYQVSIPCWRFCVRYTSSSTTHASASSLFLYENRIHISTFDTESSKLTCKRLITDEVQSKMLSRPRPQAQQPLTSSPSTINLVRFGPLRNYVTFFWNRWLKLKIFDFNN